MTRMAGANPKIAAIFGVGNFGMDYDKMGQQAQQSQNADRMTAMGVDANAAKADIDAEYIKESAPYKAALQAPQQQGGGGGFGDILGSVAGIVGGLGGGGGGANMGGAGYYDPMTGLGTAGPNFGL